MKIGMGDSNKYMQMALKRTFMTDWVLIKIACFVFGIFLVSYFTSFFIVIEWYWWFMLAIVLALPIFIKRYLVPKKRQACNPLDLACQYDMAKREMVLWDLGLIKWSAIFFGVTVAVAYPKVVLNMVDWWVYLLIFAVLCIIPMFHILQPKQTRTVTRSYKPKMGIKIKRR
jgi:hypothetical protein